jgi:hypothetical protein
MLVFSAWIPDDQKLTGTNLNLKNTVGRAMLVMLLLDVLTNFFVICTAFVEEMKVKIR